MRGLEEVFDALFEEEMASYLKQNLRHEDAGDDGEEGESFVLCPAAPGSVIGPQSADEADMWGIRLDEKNVCPMIGGAPIPVETKIALLEKLAEENDSQYFRKIAGQARRALSVLKDDPDGVLHAGISEARRSSFGNDISSRPFRRWKSIHAHVREMCEKDGYDPAELRAGVTKWRPGAERELEEACWCAVAYPRIDSPEIWFLCGEGENDVDYEANFFGYPRVNLPVPFSAGDILTIDCRPYAPAQRVVLLQKADNYDCCCLQGLYCAHDAADEEAAVWDSGALKHNYALGDYEARSCLSCMYRLARFDGVLPEKERILAEVSRYIGGDEKRGRELYDFIGPPAGDSNHWGKTAPEIRAYIREKTLQDQPRGG